jgi:hypothetical protein
MAEWKLLEAGFFWVEAAHGGGGNRLRDGGGIGKRVVQREVLLRYVTVR